MGKKAKDLTGMRFGKLLVIKKHGSNKGNVTWECLCDCGHVTTKPTTGNLTRGQAGCVKCRTGGGRKAKDLTGMRFGKLLVIKRIEGKTGCPTWECLCDCGRTTTTPTSANLKERQRSCGSCKTPNVGDRFGSLVVKDKCVMSNGKLGMLCSCDCGGEHRVTSGNLLTKQVTTCGKCNRNNRDSVVAKMLYAKLKIKHKRRTGEILGFDDFFDIIRRPCAYCGVEHSKVTTDTNNEYGYVLKSNGLDRVDSSIGYTLENSVACCTMCNSAKSDKSVDEFREMVFRTAKFLNTGETTVTKRKQNECSHNRAIAAEKALYSSFRGRVWAKEADSLLDYDQYVSLIRSPCFYCGLESSNRRKDKASEGGTYYYNGIDRIDSSVGYEKDNVVSCCRPCNVAKNDSTLAEFLDWQKRIVKHIEETNW